MIIPVRCYTCGEVLADKWIPYVKSIQSEKNTDLEVDPNSNNLDLRYINVKDPSPEKSIEGKVLDDLNLHKYCCRRMMLTNVHIISVLT
uniref:DNA-directed RNA polymerase n=1 Tax=viral metagenome TaxID=1070528 RepID=A0A6C0BUN9_9ZZZZ